MGEPAGPGGPYRPLAGVRVVELGGGAAGAYCGRLLADAGADVVAAAVSEAVRRQGIVRDGSRAEAAYAAYLGAGKRALPASPDAAALDVLCRDADLVIVGEHAGVDAARVSPRRASVALRWFGARGGYRHWRGCDLIVQALTGMPQMAGPVEGPPLWAGDRHASVIAGVTAYIAALSGLLAKPSAVPRRFEVDVLEANLVVSEMHVHFFERDGVPMKRCGVNRFHPNSPVGVYPCRDGWVGITATTPEQWRSLCALLGLAREAADERLVTRELRFARLDEVEHAMVEALAARGAADWAALGRRHKVPIVVVPDAAGILSHPVFDARGSLAPFAHDGRDLRAPRAPFGPAQSPRAARLDTPCDAAAGAGPTAGAAHDDAGRLERPLAGVTVVDFAMGWAGPLASRLLADLGADLIKIEAGRYPDWWRGVNWTREYIDARLYENAKGFCALNRGKRGVSVDLTTEAGRELALALIAGADAVVENQAAGVMDKLGLGWPVLAAANPGLVMLSMSAFGTGNAWSDTRAYGSTLEQGAGVPSFAGLPGGPPTMYHLAYGDPVGGLFGCASLLTALLARRADGRGRYVNLSMVEAMLQFTTPALLAHQLEPAGAVRRGNRHPVFAPHGFYSAQGADQWIAVAVEDAAGFAALARVIGRPEWASDAALATPEGRRAREDEIDAAIGAWSSCRPGAEAAKELQTAGVAAAPLVHAQSLTEDAHLNDAGFFIEVVREFSGPQRQAASAILQDGERLAARRPAPLMGEHTREVLAERAGVSQERCEALVRDAVITFEPTGLRAPLIAPVPSS